MAVSLHLVPINCQTMPQDKIDGMVMVTTHFFLREREEEFYCETSNQLIQPIQPYFHQFYASFLLCVIDKPNRRLQTRLNLAHKLYNFFSLLKQYSFGEITFLNYL